MKKYIVLIICLSPIILMGQIKQKKMTYEEVIQYCNKKLEQKLDSIKWLTIKADALINIKEYDKAKLEYSKVIILDDNNYKSHYGLGLSYYFLKDYKNAIKSLENSLLIYNYSDARFCLGNIYMHQKKYKKAIRQFSLSLLINKDNADAYNNRGVCYIRLSKYNLAIDDFNKSLNLDSNRVNSLYNRGHVNFLLKDYILAENDVLSALSISPNNAVALYYLGIIYLKQGKKDIACDMLIKAKKNGYVFDETFEIRNKCNIR